ncbi:MAG: DUF3500 domain-containing protein [Methyloligellaceae bacterium]
MSRADYRQFLPQPGQSRIAGETAREHAENRMKTERTQILFSEWDALGKEPFHGITTDGSIAEGLFPLNNEGVPSQTIAETATNVLSRLDDAQRRKMQFPVESDVWRKWQNTELYVENHGLRLDEVSKEIREGVVAVLRASLSTRGFEKSLAVMRLNAFLGQVIGSPEVLGEWSYIFCIFGQPSSLEPWGWQLFGHHLSLNCLVIGDQMVLTPCFLGAEIVYADSGPFTGTSLFEDEERLGLELLRSLETKERTRAIVSQSMMGDELPPGRWHFADHLHLGGAYQDNRVVPLEGLPCDKLTKIQQRNLTDLIEAYIAPLPDGPRSARLEQVERHLQDTHFCWIGGQDENNAFYYRIQSPVIFIEFDHHSGLFLTNEKPANFHVHTIVRTPNGNDYGVDLLRQHYAHAHHHHDHS